MINYIYLLLFYLAWVFVWGWLFYKLEVITKIKEIKGEV